MKKTCLFKYEQPTPRPSPRSADALAARLPLHLLLTAAAFVVFLVVATNAASAQQMPLTLIDDWTGAPFSTNAPSAELDHGIVRFRGAIAGGINDFAFDMPASLIPPPAHCVHASRSVRCHRRRACPRQHRHCRIGKQRLQRRAVLHLSRWGFLPVSQGLTAVDAHQRLDDFAARHGQRVRQPDQRDCAFEGRHTRGIHSESICNASVAPAGIDRLHSCGPGVHHARQWPPADRPRWHRDH